jgi:hypothetical protein
LPQVLSSPEFALAGGFARLGGDTASQQIDIVIYDRQYTPLIFKQDGTLVIPAEGVYAVFEAKQSIDADQVQYAAKKVASVRELHRTSLPIPSAGGPQPAKTPGHILGGLLTFESEWSPSMGGPLLKALTAAEATAPLDLGCVAAHDIFMRQDDGFAIEADKRAATAFLLELIARLQTAPTVPMIDVRAGGNVFAASEMMCMRLHDLTSTPVFACLTPRLQRAVP